MQMKYLLLYPSEVTLFFLFVQKGQSTISWVLLCAFHFHDNGLNPLGRWKMTFARICIRRLAFVSGNSNVNIGLFWLIQTVRKNSIDAASSSSAIPRIKLWDVINVILIFTSQVIALVLPHPPKRHLVENRVQRIQRTCCRHFPDFLKTTKAWPPN